MAPVLFIFLCECADITKRCNLLLTFPTIQNKYVASFIGLIKTRIIVSIPSRKSAA